MKTIPRTTDIHEGTGVDISKLALNDAGVTLCPIPNCYAAVPAASVVSHLDHHALKGHRVDRPRVAS